MNVFEEFQAIHKDCPYMRLEIYSFGFAGIRYGIANKCYISTSHTLEELYKLMLNDIKK